MSGRFEISTGRVNVNAPHAPTKSHRVGRTMYNSDMSESLFEQMKEYVGFDAADARILAGLLEPLRPLLPAVVELFYARLERDPGARTVLYENPERVAALRQALLLWMTELFSGRYDHAYYERRRNIGRVHVRVELPQHYMFTAMSIVRLALAAKIEALEISDLARALSALHKLLDLELAIMNQTYREDLVTRMQAIEHAQFEQRISESEHLATIGQLAASLAHEIKNPLAGISGALQVLGSQLPRSHPHKEIIDEALSQIDRLDAAVKDLLIFARPKPPTTAPTNLSEVVAATLTLLREEPAFRRVQVRCDGLDEAHRALADATQMQQVVTNVLLNAAHACEDGGEIDIRIIPRQRAVLLTIEDKGIGMSPDVLSRAFEPFYTTKARGTGLGLSICKRIIEAHHGTLEIKSRVGWGTRVTIELPAGS